MRWSALPGQIILEVMSAASGRDRTSRPPSIGRNVHLWGLLVGPTLPDALSAGLFEIPNPLEGCYTSCRWTRLRVTMSEQSSAGSFGAFPSGELAARTRAVRLQYDANAARTPALRAGASVTAPHVTVAGTYWRSGPATPENESDTIARLPAVQDRLQPFELALGGVESFLPHVLVCVDGSSLADATRAA